MDQFIRRACELHYCLLGVVSGWVVVSFFAIILFLCVEVCGFDLCSVSLIVCLGSCFSWWGGGARRGWICIVGLWFCLLEFGLFYGGFCVFSQCASLSLSFPMEIASATMDRSVGCYDVAVTLVQGPPPCQVLGFLMLLQFFAGIPLYT